MTVLVRALAVPLLQALEDQHLNRRNRDSGYHSGSSSGSDSSAGESDSDSSSGGDLEESAELGMLVAAHVSAVAGCFVLQRACCATIIALPGALLYPDFAHLFSLQATRLNSTLATMYTKLGNEEPAAKVQAVAALPGSTGQPESQPPDMAGVLAEGAAFAAPHLVAAAAQRALAVQQMGPGGCSACCRQLLRADAAASLHC